MRTRDGRVNSYLGRGGDKAELAKRLGAHRYIDGAAGDPAAAELVSVGGSAYAWW